MLYWLLFEFCVHGEGEGKKSRPCCYASAFKYFCDNSLHIQRCQLISLSRFKNKDKRQATILQGTTVRSNEHLDCVSYQLQSCECSGLCSIHCCHRYRCSHLFCSCQHSKLELALDLPAFKQPGCATLSLMFLGCLFCELFKLTQEIFIRNTGLHGSVSGIVGVFFNMSYLRCINQLLNSDPNTVISSMIG